MTARSQILASSIVPSDVNVRWVHDEDDTPRVTRDTSCDYVLGKVQTVVDGDPIYAASTMMGTGMANDADCVCIVREFLKETGALSSTEGVRSITEMRAYVRGSCER